MTKYSLQDRQPVLQAISECDRLGRDAFLRTYGYQRAYEYLLVHDGREYDSKAILGVAHKYANGRALGPREFSGGTAAAVRVLEGLGFEIHRVKRKPQLPLWTDEERILAFDVYLQTGPRTGYSSRDIEVQQLSSFLRARTVFPKAVRTDPRFRSPADVREKLTGFVRLDHPPQHVIRRQASYQDVRLWAQWREEAAGLHALADKIRTGSTCADLGLPPLGDDASLPTYPEPDEVGVFTSPEEGDAELLIEGQPVRVQLNRYERNPKARRECIAHYGAVCQVCGLDFSRRYGPIGDGFIHVHHLKELSSIGASYNVDPIKDLRPVCPNCHAMLHTQAPPFSITELKARIRN